MPKHGDPDAQRAWENLYKLIMLCPDPDGWLLRDKLVEATQAYGKAMKEWGVGEGWSLQENYEQDARDARDA